MSLNLTSLEAIPAKSKKFLGFRHSLVSHPYTQTDTLVGLGATAKAEVVIISEVITPAKIIFLVLNIV